jgi:phage repressor protein C with HTH and peptisase S24 domain
MVKRREAQKPIKERAAMKVVLTMIDTAGIQSYVFGSNRLRENIGASYLVNQATQDWAYQQLEQLGGHNIKDEKDRRDEADVIMRDKFIEQESQISELIYAGGGNTAILFRAQDGSADGALKNARCFAWKLSRKVLEEAPGLEIVIAHSKPFEWNPQGNELPDEIRLLRDGRLAGKKRSRQATPTPLLGLGVTAECEATGLVASQSSKGLEPELRLVSQETIKKLEARESANKRLQKLFEGVEQRDDFEFSDELDHLGRTGGEESYIAVIHVDGNSMGELIKEYVGKAKDNRKYIERMRAFSAGVKRASRAALIKTLDTLRRYIEPGDDPKTGHKFQQVVEAAPKVVKPDRRVMSQQKRIRLFQEGKEKRSNSKPCWPFRPFVFGGDDVTFVCNGQLGLSLATIYMNAFTVATRELLEDSVDKEIHTGAGVCIVKVHYPFRRAYDLSEKLAKGAKRHLGEDKRRASAIDWHISSTGLSGSLGAIREREYNVSEGSLLMRPVRLKSNTDWRTWENFNQMVADLNFDEEWAEHRNKVKSLREALRNGIQAVKGFLKINKISLPKLTSAAANLHEQGWESKRCAYFDAIEAMDHHFLLEEVANGKVN